MKLAAASLDRPARRIPYSAPMARARRDDAKTQTRRIASSQPPADCGRISVSKYHPTVIDRFGDEQPGDEIYGAYDESGEWGSKSPYGAPGDILIPVEAWRAPVEFDGVRPSDIPAGTPIWREADGKAPAGFGRYRHARFLPTHLVSARDRVVSIRFERLQDITESDAREEGCGFLLPEYEQWDGDPDLYRKLYRVLWERINEQGSWKENPYVWVVEFEILIP